MFLRVILFISFASWLSLATSTAQNATANRVTISPISDNISPKIVAQQPSQASINVSITTQIVIQFDEAIQKGNGNLVIQNKETQVPVQIIDISSLNNQSDHNKLTLHLTVPLAHNTAYTILMDKGYVKDMTGNSFERAKAEKPWYFTTQKLAEQKALNVFPNPATDHFTVQLKGINMPTF